MNKARKILSIISLMAVMTLAIATPVFAFEGREGDKIVITKDEVINDDLYIGAEILVVEGTVNGDVIVGAQSITINGTVTGDLIAAGEIIIINGTIGGDLWAAGQVVIINGVVMESARIAGAGLQLGEDAQIMGDLLTAGGSVEIIAGSSVSRDLLIGAGQALVAGDVGRDLNAGAGALEIQGSIGRNVKAYIGQTDSPRPDMYMENIPLVLPNVAPGFTIAQGAKVAGDLEYSSTYDLTFPSGSVKGDVNRVEQQHQEQKTYVPPTQAERTVSWAFDLVRSIVTLILVGLLFGWLTPKFMKSVSSKIETQTWPSLGWGAVAWAAFFVALLVIIIVMIGGALIFGLLTLGGLSAAIIVLGILDLFALIVIFVLTTAYLTKIVVGTALGKWIFSKANPALAEHRFWPMLLGVTLIVFVLALFHIPVLPGAVKFFGVLLNLTVVFFGLGALWIWGRERMSKKSI